MMNQKKITHLQFFWRVMRGERVSRISSRVGGIRRIRGIHRFVRFSKVSPVRE
jgi:hypothetical protein